MFCDLAACKHCYCLNHRYSTSTPMADNRRVASPERKYVNETAGIQLRSVDSQGNVVSNLPSEVLDAHNKSLHLLCPLEYFSLFMYNELFACQ